MTIGQLPHNPNTSIRFIDDTGFSYGISQIGNKPCIIPYAYDSITGTYVQIFQKFLDGKPRVSTTSYGTDISHRNFTDHFPVVKLGFNSDIGTSEEDLWPVGGVFVPPTGEMQMEIVSTSAQDDPDVGAGVPGTGVHSVVVYYLNAAGTQKTSIEDVNGLTPRLTTATDIAFINGFRAVDVGAGLQAAGNIDIRHVSDTPVYSRIEAGYTRARNANYKVPAGYNLYIESYVTCVYGANKGVRFTPRTNYDPDADQLRDFFLAGAEVTMTNGTFIRDLQIETRVPAGTVIKISGKADQAGAVCSCSIRGWIEVA